MYDVLLDRIRCGTEIFYLPKEQSAIQSIHPVKYILRKKMLLANFVFKKDEKQLDWDRKAALLLKVAMPILRNLQQWLTVEQQNVLPQSAIGKAIAYSRGKWNRPIRYTQSGGLMIDNNLIENQIRPLALGRKNFLFEGSR